MGEGKAGPGKGWKALFFAGLATFYGGFAAVTQRPADVLGVWYEGPIPDGVLPPRAASVLEAVRFLRTYFWAVSGMVGALGGLAAFGALRGSIKPLVVSFLLGDLATASAVYVVRGAAEHAVRATGEAIERRAMDELKNRLPGAAEGK